MQIFDFGSVDNKLPNLNPPVQNKFSQGFVIGGLLLSRFFSRRLLLRFGRQITVSINADIKLAMSGDDAPTIKKTLNGNGQVRFNDGAIIGIDLAGMVRNVKSAFGLEQKPAQRPRTDFAELAAPFSIKQGNVHTPQTSLKSPLIRVIAAGDANLVKETLDFRVEPKVVGTIKGQGDTEDRAGLMVPVLVSGTFSDPQFKPDLAGMAQKKLQDTLSGKDGSMDKESLEETGKSILKGILGQ